MERAKFSIIGAGVIGLSVAEYIRRIGKRIALP